MHQTRIQHLADRRLTDLSGGQRQRAFLAMVTAQNTPVILLDEPTTYLDINHRGTDAVDGRTPGSGENGSRSAARP